MLSPFERRVLQAISDLGSSAYPLDIQEALGGGVRWMRGPALGAVHATLWYLEEAGFVARQEEEGGPERGNRPKLLYWLRGDGRRALEEQ